MPRVAALLVCLAVPAGCSRSKPAMTPRVVALEMPPPPARVISTPPEPVAPTEATTMDRPAPASRPARSNRAAQSRPDAKPAEPARTDSAEAPVTAQSPAPAVPFGTDGSAPLTDAELAANDQVAPIPMQRPDRTLVASVPETPAPIAPQPATPDTAVMALAALTPPAPAQTAEGNDTVVAAYAPEEKPALRTASLGSDPALGTVAGLVDMTWNAVGKRRGTWGLDADAAESSRGFLLNHVIGDLLPPVSAGRRYSNSDPVTGQAAWFDLRVRLVACDPAEEGFTEPQFARLEAPPHFLPAPPKLAFGAEFRRQREKAR